LFTGAEAICQQRGIVGSMKPRVMQTRNENFLEMRQPDQVFDPAVGVPNSAIVVVATLALKIEGAVNVYYSRGNYERYRP